MTSVYDPSWLKYKIKIKILYLTGKQEKKKADATWNREEPFLKSPTDTADVCKRLICYSSKPVKFGDGLSHGNR